MDKALLMILLIGGGTVVFWFIVIHIYSNIINQEISDKLHELDCQELKAFILSEEDPSQHALNHWTVCTAGGWK